MKVTKPTAIIFNGPPGSGKDYIVKSLIECNSNAVSFHREFKARLYTLTMGIYGVWYDDFFDIYNNREQKELPQDIFEGLSIRQAMIKVSEEVIKPVFGNDYFGIAAAKSMLPGINAFSDGGFIEEMQPIYDYTDGNMIIIRIHADGYNFNSDSRNYMTEFKDVPIIDVNNDKTSKFIDDCTSIIDQYIVKQYVTDNSYYYKVDKSNGSS